MWSYILTYFGLFWLLFFVRFYLRVDIVISRNGVNILYSVFRAGTFDSSAFSAKSTFISASVVPHP